MVIKRMKLNRILITGLLILLIPGTTALLAETIYMKNGQKIVGHIVGQTRNDVRINVGGKISVIPKKQIRRISFRTEDPGTTEVKTVVKPPKREYSKKQIAAMEATIADQQSQIRALEKQMIAVESLFSEMLTQEQPEPVVQTIQTTAGGKTIQVGPPPGVLAMTWRSAVLPGWGHIHAGRGVGWFYSALFASGALLAYNQRQNALAAQVDYETSQGLLMTSALSSAAGFAAMGANVLRDGSAANAAAANYNRSLVLLGGIYVFQLTHAIIVGIKGGASALAPQPSGDGLSALSIPERTPGGWDLQLLPETSPSPSPIAATGLRTQFSYGMRF